MSSRHSDLERLACFIIPSDRWGNPKDEFIRSLVDVEKKLEDLWDRIGLTEVEIEKRVNRVFGVLREVLDEMIVQENELRENLEKNVLTYQSRILELTRDLHMQYESPKTSDTLLLKENELKKMVNSLEIKRKKYLNQWHKLLNLQKTISDQLDLEVSPIEINGIPTDHQIHSISKNITDLEKELTSRQTKFTLLKNELKQLLVAIDAPINDQVREWVFDTREVKMKCSQKNMKDLIEYKGNIEREFHENKTRIERLWSSVEFLWGLLNTEKCHIESFKSNNQKMSSTVLNNLKLEESRLKNLRHGNLAVYIPKLKEKLISLWNKCRFGNQKREQFLRVYGDGINENSLSAYEDALLSANSYYESNREILEMLQKRDEMWDTYCKMELNQMGRDKYNNRGGALLKEEKLRKSILRDLPKLESDLGLLIAEWESSNKTEFMIDDTSYHDYIFSQSEALKHEKEERKKLRQISRTPLCTPIKSRLNNTVMNSSRLNSTIKSRVCATETCNRIRKEPIVQLTPIKRRSSFLWPPEDSFIPIRTPAKSRNIKNTVTPDVLKPSNVHNISPNVAFVSPIYSKNLKNNDKSVNKSLNKSINKSKLETSTSKVCVL
ncbi:Protein regulator of cytokinesis 1 [Thelohanellus kitauei]|uniref:Protein regulator of cytokinesis 1 n=1 Tax=Thelohanellus kitauei TaxID=669202 RepID=A0A0C2MMI8_THEKT|nr:Protein regulator of cytokinesis 1 [Thelohanellus kitauei]